MCMVDIVCWSDVSAQNEYVCGETANKKRVDLSRAGACIRLKHTCEKKLQNVVREGKRHITTVSIVALKMLSRNA